MGEPKAAGPLDSSSISLALLISELSHDLTHTWTFLRCWTGDLEEDPTGGNLEETRDLVHRESERLQRLLRRLRRFKLPCPVPDPVDVKGIVEASLTCVHEVAGARGIKVDVDVGACTRVWADDGFLQTGLQHLLLHAAGNCPADGHISVCASDVHTGKDARVRIDIWDDGPPLDVENPVGLFDFWQLTEGDELAAHRAFGRRLLYDVAATLTYQRIEARNLFQVTLPVVKSAPR